MMAMFIELVPVGLQQGLLLSLVALGVMIPFRLLNFPDLTSEGSYPLGAAATAALIVAGLSPVGALLLGAGLGGLLGVCTAWVHIRYNVNTLLAGIIMSTMAYSVNLRLMGKPNMGLFDVSTVFSPFAGHMGARIMCVLLVSVVLSALLWFFLKTEKGLCFRAVGLNPLFAERQGLVLSRHVIGGLFVGNALCGLGGGLMVQAQGYADIGMGVGIVIHALAALMIGESVVGTKTLARQIGACLVGALIYQQIQGLALSLGMAPSDLKLLTGGIVLLVLMGRGR